MRRLSRDRCCEDNHRHHIDTRTEASDTRCAKHEKWEECNGTTSYGLITHVRCSVVGLRSRLFTSTPLFLGCVFCLFGCDSESIWWSYGLSVFYSTDLLTSSCIISLKPWSEPLASFCDCPRTSRATGPVASAAASGR